MSRSEELIADALQLLHARGFTPRVQENGKHIKLRWFDFGRQYTLVVSKSPSDVNARQNSRATLRRLLRDPRRGQAGREEWEMSELLICWQSRRAGRR
jgi:hypothetical protein